MTLYSCLQSLIHVGKFIMSLLIDIFVVKLTFAMEAVLRCCIINTSCRIMFIDYINTTLFKIYIIKVNRPTMRIEYLT